MKSGRKLIPNDNYWPQVLIALAQVTFGVAWGSLFFPVDFFKLIVIVANLLLSAILIIWGYLIRKKK